jgi:heme o synthase
MGAEPILIVAPPATNAGNTPAAWPIFKRTRVADYWALTKPEVNFLIGIATLTGFYLGLARNQGFPWLSAINTVLGTLLVASGTGTLNQYIERRFDAAMRRTARRPLAAGRMYPSSALWFGVALSAAGVGYLALTANLLTSLLSLLTLVIYLFVYTPLKRITPACVLVGALPGAVPPLIGWAAAAGTLNFAAWKLYAILFLWQFPHFMAIAWMYREDYERAGYLVLPNGGLRDRLVSLQTLLPLIALVPVSVATTSIGHAGVLYSIGALLISLGFFYYGAEFVVRRSGAAARRLLMASIVYLPVLFTLLMVSGR